MLTFWLSLMKLLSSITERKSALLLSAMIYFSIFSLKAEVIDSSLWYYSEVCYF